MSRQCLNNLEEIGRFLHRNLNTVRNWIENYDLPAFPRPIDEWESCTLLIQHWLMLRAEKQRKERDD